MEFLWLLALFLVPVLFVTAGVMSSGYGIPKVTLYRSLVGLMAALWVIEWGLTLHPARAQLPPVSRAKAKEWLFGQPTRWVLVGACLVLVSNLISTLLSPSIRVSLWGSEPALDGYSFYNAFSHFVLFAVVATHLKTTAQLWRLVGAVIASGVVVGVYGILQHFGLDPFGVHIVGTRVVSTLGNPIFTAAFLLMVVPLTLAMALRFQKLPKSWSGMVLWTVVLTVPVLTVAITLARGPWMGFAIAVVAFLVLVAVSAGWRPGLRAGALVAASLMITWAVINLVPPTSIRPEQSPVTPVPRALSVPLAVEAALPLLSPSNAPKVTKTAPSSMETRVLLWRSAGRLVLNRPWFEIDDRPPSLTLHLFGYGPEFFQYFFPLERPDALSHLVGDVYYAARDAHNNPVHRLVELGYLGLASYLFLLGAVLVAGIALLARRRPPLVPNGRLIVAALLASLAGRTVEQLVGIPHLSDEALFWALLALMVALPNLQEHPAEARWASDGVQPNIDRSSAGRVAVAGAGLRLLLALTLAAMLAAFTMIKNPYYALAEIRATSATVSLEEGDLAMAMGHIEGAISLAPDVGRYHVTRAQIFGQAGGIVAKEPNRTKLAREAYLATERAVAANPFDMYSRLQFAESTLTLAGLGQPGMSEKAIEEYQRLTYLRPRYWLSHFLLGRAYTETGQQDRAVVAYGEAIRLNQSSFFYLQRGIAYADLGQYQPAVEDYDEAIEISPSNASAYNRRGIALFALGRLEEAIQDFDEAIENYLQKMEIRYNYPKSEADKWIPSLATAHNNRGSVYYRLGRIERAIEDYDLAIQLSPQSAEFYTNRAQAYELLEKDAEALRDLERAIELGFGPAPPERD